MPGSYVIYCLEVSGMGEKVEYEYNFCWGRSYGEAYIGNGV